MGKHARSPRRTTGGNGEQKIIRTRPLPVMASLRLRSPVDIWHKPALSAVVALGLPDMTLLALGRLDLVLYTSAGAMCALYGHGLPYAARARTVARVVAGMVASLAVALVTASLAPPASVLVLVASVVAALHKVGCDATRVGPPGNLILTFITASAFFVPQRLAEVPGHVATALACGALAWAVCMAPWLVRRHGPERIAVARALEAAAAHVRHEADGAASASSGLVAGTRHATASAVNEAWRCLFLVSARHPAAQTTCEALERLLVRAEATLGATEASTTTEELLAWARDLRRGRPLPAVQLSPAQHEELTGVRADTRGAPPDALRGQTAKSLRSPRPHRATGATTRDRAALGRPRRREHPVLARLAPGAALWPIGARALVGCALSGWGSLAIGVGHPYWAVVTAASVYQANTTMSWQRAFQRTVGNLLGLALFTVLLPVIHTGQPAMVVLALVFQFGAEACITRNYWLGSVSVTPMALLVTQFGNPLPASVLVRDRWIDTLVGAAVGVACCLLVTNRRASGRVEAALRRLRQAEATAGRLLAEHDTGRVGSTASTGAAASRSIPTGANASGSAQPSPWTTRAEDEPLPPALGPARDRLAAALLDLREAVEVATGEWWQRTVPEEEVTVAEREGHRTLAHVVRVLSAPALAA